MRTFLGLAVVILILGGLSLATFAQQDSANSPGPAMQQGQEKQVTPEQFAAMKSRIFTMIETRRAKLDEEKACVTAATTPAELRKCRPKHPMGMGPGRGQRGPGRQQPSQAPAGQSQ